MRADRLGRRLSAARADFRGGARALVLLAAFAVSMPAVAADAGTSDAGAPPRAAPRGEAPGSPGGGAAEVAADPHGHGTNGHEGMLQVPEDRATEDPSLPRGTLAVQVLDREGRPLASTPVTIGVLYNSVAKGESRKHVTATTNDEGVARLDDLETGSAVAYRPMVLSDGATFSAMPFRLPDESGMRAVLHVYPVVSDLDAALIVSQSMIYVEVKDDRVQVQQAFRIYNFGKSAWVPKDLLVPLPEDFTAFTSQQGMSDVGVEAVAKKGVRLRGTFGPGQHLLEFRWQLPYSGAPSVRFDVGMAPHVAAARVLTPASRDMKLEVPGFPRPEATSDGMGQRMLLTERQVRREDPSLSKIEVIIKDLPTEGPGKILATALAGAGVLAGIVLGAKRAGSRDRERERRRILSDIEELERARSHGDLGPKTYERARQDLLDELARTYAEEEPRPPRRARRREA